MLLDLRKDDCRVRLDPLTGGAIAAFSWRGIEVLRPVRDPRLRAQHGRAVAGYPLIPYANRIAQGRFSLGGEPFQLERNFGDEPGSIHGNAWMRAWRVAEAGGERARLELCHRPPHDPVSEWPFAYDAVQEFAVFADRLELRLSVRNRDERAFPAGIGLHPYVARTARARLQFEADTVWRTGADGLPSDRVAVPEDMDFDRGREIAGQVIDSCFAGWGGTARMELPEHGIAVVIEAAAPLDHVQVYTPRAKDYCGLEPVSNMPDGINRMADVADQGMVMLGAGEELSGAVVIRLEGLGDHLPDERAAPG
jgi:aldose 1-epimerase